VYLFSTLHHDDSIDKNSGQQEKPEIITFYNVTKGGVDAVDQLSATYDVSRNSRRCPLTIFFTILNTASINSDVVFRNNTNNYKIPRREFIKASYS